MFRRFLSLSSGFLPLVAGFLALAILSSGCETTGGQNSSGTVASPSTSPAPNPVPALSADRIQVGDRITLVYADIPNAPSPAEQQVRDDGKVTIHLGYPFEAAGKTRGALEKEIKDFYVGRGFYKEINVTVHMQIRYISVGGEVRTANQYPYLGEMTVLKAINAAGGCTDFADRKKVVITRAGDKSQITVNLKKAIKDPKLDLPVYPGDSIYVHKGL